MMSSLMFPDISLSHAFLYRMVCDIISLQSFLICSTPLLFGYCLFGVILLLLSPHGLAVGTDVLCDLSSLHVVASALFRLP